MSNKKLYKKDLELFLRELGFYPSGIYIDRSKKKSYIRFKAEANKISFESLMKLSERFKTTKIDVDDYSYSPGCPTCDYGSERTVEIVIYEPKW